MLPSGSGAGNPSQQQQQQQQEQNCPKPLSPPPRGRVGFCMWTIGPLIYVWGGYEVHRNNSIHQSHADLVNEFGDENMGLDNHGANLPPGLLVDEIDFMDMAADFDDDADLFENEGFVGNHQMDANAAHFPGPVEQQRFYYRQSTWVKGDKLLCYCTDSRKWLKIPLNLRDLGVETHQHRNFLSGFSGSACCVDAEETRLYISGGFNESVHKALSATNAVYSIHVNRNRQVSRLAGFPVVCQFSMESRGPSDQLVPAPRDKHSCIYWRNSLIIFGGYCLNPPTTLMNPVDYCGSSFSLQDVFFRSECFQPNDSLRFAWSNELLQLDLASGAWSQLDPEGTGPTPRAAHSMLRVGSRALLFGGRVLDRRTNDLFSLCLETLQWTRLQPLGALPEPRSWTAFVQVAPRHVFCFGGYPWAQPPAVLKPFNNCFLYDLLENRFTRLQLPDRPGLLWHGSCAHQNSRSAFVWGGCTEDIMLPVYRHDFNSTVLEFPRLLVPKLAAMCSDVIVRSPERYPLSVLAHLAPVTNELVHRRLLMSGPLVGG